MDFIINNIISPSKHKKPRGITEIHTVINEQTKPEDPLSEEDKISDLDVTGIGLF